MEDNYMASNFSGSAKVSRKVPMSISAVGKAMSQELQKPVVRRVAEAALLLKNSGNHDDIGSARDRHEEIQGRMPPRGLYFGRDVATSMWWKYKRDGGVSESGTSDYDFPRNLFQTEPKDGERFNSKKMEGCMQETLERFLTMEKYDSKRGSVLAKQLAEEIKVSAKSLGFKRYRLIVRVDIGSKLTQEVNVASKFLWNVKTDSFASVSFTNDTMFAVATVFAVYLD